MTIYFGDTESIRAVMLSLGEEKDEIVEILVYEACKNPIGSKRMKALTEKIFQQYQNLYGEK